MEVLVFLERKTRRRKWKFQLIELVMVEKKYERYGTERPGEKIMEKNHRAPGSLMWGRCFDSITDDSFSYVSIVAMDRHYFD